MMSDHAERKIDRFFWLLIACAVLYLIGHLVVAFTRDAFPPDSAIQPVAQTSSTTVAVTVEVTTSSSAAPVVVTPPAPSVTPPAPSVWLRLADCESGEWVRRGGRLSFTPGSARWDAHDGVHQGGLQFAGGTWLAFGGGEFAHEAWMATSAQQIRVAERVLAKQGPSAWPTCGPLVGLRRSS